MANIAAKIAQIRAAILGKDVRESIASGIEGINLEVVSTTGKEDLLKISQDALRTQFDDEVINMTLADPSSAEIVAGRTSNVTSQSFDTIGHRGDNVDTQLSDMVHYVSIAKYNNNLLLALASESNIFIPEGTYEVTATLTSDLLHGKTIKGVSRKSILHFVGDIDCLQLYGINIPTLIEDITISVDNNNTHNAVIVSPDNIVRVSEIRMKGIFINTISGTMGNYIGLKLLDTSGQGIYKTSYDDIEIKNCKIGLVLETNLLSPATVAGWITHNLFTGLYINLYSDTAIKFIQSLGSITANSISNARINLGPVGTTTDKTMFKVAGMNNFITDLVFFNDSSDNCTVYSCDFSDDTSNSNYITGYFEGLIKNEKNIINHYFNVLGMKDINGLSYNYIPYQNYNNNITNLIKNYNFENGLYGWTASGATATIDKTINSFFTNSAKLVSTGSAIDLHKDIPVPSKFVGKYATFTAKVTSNCKCYTLIDEGVPGMSIGSYHSGNNTSEIISVTKKITGGGIVRVLVGIGSGVLTGNYINVEWVCLNIGIMSPTNPVTAKTHYISSNKGIATIEANTTEVIVNHGLDITPNYEDFHISNRYNFNASPATKVWVSLVTSTTFTITVDTVFTEMIQFCWDVDTYN